MAADLSMSVARRLARRWRLYFAMDLLSLARGPGLALSYYAADLLIGVAAVTATFLLAARFDGLGPWTRDQVLFMLGYALAVRGLVSSLFNYNVFTISRRIGRGQLDHLLVQPQPLWMALLTEGLAPVTGSGMLVPGLGLLGWSLSRSELSATPLWLALLGLDLCASVVVVFSFNYLWGSLAFWAPRATEEISSSTTDLMTQLSPFPLDGLGGPLLGALLSVVPVGLVAWLPCRVLLGADASPVGVLGLPVAAVLLGLSAMVAFRAGLRHYGRTGSTRYLDRGHRR
jgi:ABC-2 type transport system permease protein